MMDWNTYFATRHNSGQPIVRLLDPSIDRGGDRTGGSTSTGALIGRAISLTLIAGTLLYCYLIR